MRWAFLIFRWGRFDLHLVIDLDDNEGVGPQQPAHEELSAGVKEGVIPNQEGFSYLNAVGGMDEGARYRIGIRLSLRFTSWALHQGGMVVYEGEDQSDADGERVPKLRPGVRVVARNVDMR